ncbi:DNA cytosine methyltransferase [Vibrio parahaemolyticus]|nr:DNA cytosine methyltransferase [Vibrio parahaemolyticus]
MSYYVSDAPKKRLLSLFSGIGGLDYGFIANGWNPVYVNEFQKNTAKSYELIHGHKVDTTDLREVDIDSLPDAEVIIGGPPCQSFSLVGKRLADDPRGELVHRFVEVVLKKKPMAFVMENVPGMLSSKVNDIRLIDILEDKFEQAGYFVNRAKVMATDFGVPQKRQRVILLGSRVSCPQMPTTEEFFKSMGLPLDNYPLSASAAIGDLCSPVQKGETASYNDSEPSPFAKLMRALGDEHFTLHEMPRMSETDSQYVKNIPPGGNYHDIPDEIATNRVLYFKKTGGRTTTYGRLHPDRPSYTINTAFRRPNVGCNFHYKEERLITAREAMRFQSMPDHWNLIYTAQDERNTMIGNAVPPLVSQAIRIAIENSLG